MELDREARLQIVLSLVAVGFFIVLIVGIGVALPDQAFHETGALALVAAITLFILVMGAVGIYMARQGF